MLGVALFPDHAAGAEALIDAADAALSMRPAGGTGAIRYHERTVFAVTSFRQGLRHRLRAAISRDELRIVYQPKVEVHSGAARGAEALVRWTDPARGPVSPLNIIAAAEGSELIHELGAWVLGRVARQVHAWRAEGLNPGPIAVNLSGAELLHPGLCPRVKGVLQQFELEPDAIQIEITETALVEDFEQASERLADLRRLGISCALDDCGTGYSSFSLLAAAAGRVPEDRPRVHQRHCN